MSVYRCRACAGTGRDPVWALLAYVYTLVPTIEIGLSRIHPEMQTHIRACCAAEGLSEAVFVEMCVHANTELDAHAAMQEPMDDFEVL